MVTTKELTGLEKEKEKHNTTAINWNGKNYPIFQKHSINVMADQILNALDSYKFQQMLVCGKSGTGKTKFVESLIHKMSCSREKKFHIEWHNREEVLELPKIIDELPRGLDCVLVLDDISFELDKAGNKQKKDIFSKLTTIRHEVQGQKIFVVMISHYSRSISKPLRECDFTVLLSLSNVERENWMEIWGKESYWKLRNFQSQFANSAKNKKFRVTHEGESYYYKTFEPFNIALKNHLGIEISPIVFMDDSCNHCRFKKDDKIKIDAEQLWKEFEKAYGYTARDVIQWFAYFHKGVKDALPMPKKRVLDYLLTRLAQYDTDIDKLVDIATNIKRTGLKKQSHYGRIYNELDKNVIGQNDKTNT
jgi:hypothetical protein